MPPTNKDNNEEDDISDLALDPAVLAGLSTQERAAAIATARAARRAEERAEQRALAAAMERKRAARLREKQQEAQVAAASASSAASTPGGAARLVYVPKGKRAAATDTGEEKGKTAAANNPPAVAASRVKPSQQQQQQQSIARRRPADWTEQEFSAVRETYLGKSAAIVDEAPAPKKRKPANKKMTFKFRWDDTDDTFGNQNGEDPLYSWKPNNNNNNNNNHGGSQNDRNNRRRQKADPITTVRSVQDKPLERMTARDWRILRENYQIVVRGGKAPPPLRSFRESPAPDILPPLHPALLDAIENVLRFKEPSPIQRQAIPIGLQRRDLIGIAETGSGKTVAFGVPLCHYLLHLPAPVLSNVATDGPLALIMAPTRELALQIHVEMDKLLQRQSTIRACAIVGGQSIQQQAQVLRQGVHIVVGTPGRINDCIDMAYLVLNQCCYIVLDEADRMIDMGFAPQMESILDAMGGSIKSEKEDETYQQEMEDLKQGGLARHRLTAMFSATMPLEVERMAKQYLRHPAIVSIGDPDSSGKNARITQRVLFLSSVAQKEKALRDLLLDPRFVREKVIVFVNEKRHADQVGRLVDRIMGRPCVVMHGGKTQEQREEGLERFRRGGVVMVATDVAGRGYVVVVLVLRMFL